MRSDETNVDRRSLNPLFLREGKCIRIVLVFLAGIGVLWILFAPRMWSEEVKLSDGTNMEVYRLGVKWRVGEPGHHGQLIIEWALFSHMNHWYLWSGDIQAVLIDFYKSVPYIAGIAGTTKSCARYQDATPFVFFRYGKGWERLRPEAFPDGLEVNLLLGSYSHNQWHYSLGEKRDLDRSAKMDLFFHGPIKSINFGCS